MCWFLHLWEGASVSGAQWKWGQSHPSRLVWFLNDSRCFQHERGNRKTLEWFLDDLGVFLSVKQAPEICVGVQ